MTVTNISDGRTQQRFARMTLTEARERATKRPHFLYDDIVSSESTLIYGETEVGKSTFVAGLLAATTGGSSFLGQDLRGEPRYPAIGWTDDGATDEYAERICSVDPSADLAFYELDPMPKYEDWRELHGLVKRQGHDLLVIDHLADTLPGSVNNDELIREFYRGVSLFTRDDIPVIIVAHSSEKFGERGKSRDPIGSSFIRIRARMSCFMSRKGGDIKLEFRGNRIGAHSKTLRQPDPRIPRYEIIGKESAEEKRERSRNRSTGTLNARDGWARLIVAQCQGLSLRETAEKMAPAFELSESTVRSYLSKGTIPVHQAESGWALNDGC